jgi:hypothetical protein
MRQVRSSGRLPLTCTPGWLLRDLAGSQADRSAPGPDNTASGDSVELPNARTAGSALATMSVEGGMMFGWAGLIWLVIGLARRTCTGGL